MLSKLIPKRGVDKNGRQYTRLVRDDSNQDNDRVKTVSFPTIPANESRSEYVETSESILKEIDKSERANISPEQLDKVFEIMKKYGTQEDDSWGFRNYFATLEGHKEWSERGAGARLIHDFDRDGNVRSLNLYSINDYKVDDYAEFYKAQAELRSVFGIAPYDQYEARFLATRYWNGHLLKEYENEPQKVIAEARYAFIDKMIENPDSLAETVDLLIEKPMDEIGDVSVYVSNAVGSTDFRNKFLNKWESGKINQAKRMVADNASRQLDPFTQRALSLRLKSEKQMTAATA